MIFHGAFRALLLICGFVVLFADSARADRASIEAALSLEFNQDSMASQMLWLPFAAAYWPELETAPEANIEQVQKVAVRPARRSFVPNVTVLEQAVKFGVLNNPDYRAAISQHAVAWTQNKQAQASFLPTIDFRADMGIEHTDNTSSRNPPDDEPEELGRYSASLTLTQFLFDGWATRYENERTRASLKSAQWRASESVQLIGLSIVEAYLEVLRRRDLLKIARENVKDHKDVFRQISDNAQAGQTAQVNVEQVRARLALANAREVAALRQGKVADSNYLREVGEWPVNLQPPDVPRHKLPDLVDDEVIFAREISPTLAVFKSEIDVAAANKNEAHAAFYPALDLEFNAQEGKDLAGIKGSDKSASLLLLMNWNLYRGGGDTARLQEFEHRYFQAKDAHEDALRAIEDDIRQSWSRLTAAEQRIKAFAAQIDYNEQVVVSYKEQFDLRRRTLLNVLDAQNELFQARSSVINEGFVRDLSIYRLIALRGQLMDVLGVADEENLFFMAGMK